MAFFPLFRQRMLLYCCWTHTLAERAWKGLYPVKLLIQSAFAVIVAAVVVADFFLSYRAAKAELRE